MRFPLLHVLCIGVACLVIGCHKDPPQKKSSGKTKREESIRRSQDRETTEKFVNALRDVMVWQHDQPAPQGQAAHAAAVQEFSKRLQAVPSKEMPDDVLKEWRNLKRATQQLADALAAPTPPAAAALQKLKDDGKKASAALNQWLNTEGFGDLHL